MFSIPESQGIRPKIFCIESPMVSLMASRPKLWCYAGINNLGQSPSVTPAELAEGLKAIVARLRAKSPTTKILLLSIFPTAEPNQSRIEQTDKLPAGLGDDKSGFFLDIYALFLDRDKHFSASISTDGLHLNAMGYQVWGDALRPTCWK